MAYQICKRCSKMFPKNGKLYCKDCIEKAEKEHDLIIDYVTQHPNATILDIITETGVTLKSINALVEDGYVSYTENKLKTIDPEKVAKVADKIIDKKGQFYVRKK